MVRRAVVLLLLIGSVFLAQQSATAESAMSCPTARLKLPAVKSGETVHDYVKRLFELTALKSSSISNARLIYKIDPAADKAQSKMIATSVRAAKSYWSRFQNLPSDLKVLIAKSPSYVRQNLHGPDLQQWKDVTSDGIGEWSSHLSSENVLLFYGPRGMPVTDAAYQQVGAHELFHYLQFLMSDNHDQKSALTPLWFEEGTAYLFASNVMEREGYPNIRRDSMDKFHVYTRGTKGRPVQLEAFKDDRLMIFTNEKDSLRAQQIYPMGNLAAELFVSRAGVEGLASIFYCMRDGKPWDQHFRTLTGMTSTQFIRDANKYINEVYDGKERLMR